MDANAFPKKKMKLILLVIVLMTVLNLLIFVLLPYNDSLTHLDGSTVTHNEAIKAAISSIIFGIPIIGFLLGLLISLIPYRGLTYRQKYLPFSLITIAALHVIIFARIIISTIF